MSPYDFLALFTALVIARRKIVLLYEEKNPLCTFNQRNTKQMNNTFSFFFFSKENMIETSLALTFAFGMFG
jgi:hypothetical protein